MIKKAFEIIGRMKTTKLKSIDKTSSSSLMTVTLCDQNLEIATILAEAFKDQKRVEVVHGNILDLQGDALVSPTNSFGDMSGGLDKAIDDYFCGEAQKRIQHEIKRDCYGELQVGNAIMVETDYIKFPYLIFAPTMRIPGPVDKTLNAYLSMRAILIEAEKKKVNKVVIPSLCTGIGRMPYLEAAEQMLTAYETIVLGDWMRIVHPLIAPYANRRQEN